MNKRQTPVVNIGSSSMLVIFVVLCLVTFATLSLASAKNDYDYSRTIADRRADYYTACDTAQKMLNSIDSTLADVYDNMDDHDDYFTSAKYALAGLEMDQVDISMNFSSAEPTVTYVIPINDTQSLQISLVLKDSASLDEGYYTITQWQTINTEEWTSDDTMNLMEF